MTKASKLTDLTDKLRQTRARTLELLAGLPPADLELGTEIRGRTMRGLLWMMAEHYAAHRTQIYNNRIATEARSTEVNALLASAQRSFEEALCYVSGLSDAEGEVSPAPGEWSTHQILEHLLEFEQRYQREFDRVLRQRASRNQET
jgi:hypothetical protein